MVHRKLRPSVSEIAKRKNGDDFFHIVDNIFDELIPHTRILSALAYGEPKIPCQVPDSGACDALVPMLSI